MTIRDLYAKYHIMPQLATHMLRVAGVGKIIAEHWKARCDVRFVTELCLLHDVGNLVKFDLSEKEENKMYGPIENAAKWRARQQEYWKKYGKNAHDATIGILREAGLTQFEAPIREEEQLYFLEPKEAELAKASVPAIILMYADCRVTPAGVTSYRERIDDLKTRYGGVATNTWYGWTYWFEDWMEAQTDFDLQSITEKSVTPLFDEMLGYNI